MGRLWGDNIKNEKINDIRSTTTKAGQIAWIEFEWGSHPGLIIGIENGYLRVVSGTSQTWHEGDEEGFVKVEVEFLPKATWFQITEAYLIHESSLKSIAGEVPDDLFREISGRVEGL